MNLKAVSAIAVVVDSLCAACENSQRKRGGRYDVSRGLQGEEGERQSLKPQHIIGIELKIICSDDDLRGKKQKWNGIAVLGQW